MFASEYSSACSPSIADSCAGLLRLVALFGLFYLVYSQYIQWILFSLQWLMVLFDGIIWRPMTASIGANRPVPCIHGSIPRFLLCLFSEESLLCMWQSLESAMQQQPVKPIQCTHIWFRIWRAAIQHKGFSPCFQLGQSRGLRADSTRQCLLSNAIQWSAA